MGRGGGRPTSLEFKVSVEPSLPHSTRHLCRVRLAWRHTDGKTAFSSVAAESRGRHRGEGHGVRGCSLLLLGLSFLCYTMGRMLQHTVQDGNKLSVVMCASALAQRSAPEPKAALGEREPSPLHPQCC